MKVRLAYGEKGIVIDIPYRNTTVVQPKAAPPLLDAPFALREALRAPMGRPRLRDVASASDTVAIVFSDGTRPQPRALMLEALFEELAAVPSDQIVLINALGSHRANTPAELEEMLGPAIARRYRVVQHNAWDRSRMMRLPDSGCVRDVWVNSDYMRASIRVLTGFIEPHFFAGFSGGPKAVFPGLVDQASVLANHSARLIGHPQATWGVTAGNPIWDQMFQAAAATRPTMLLNVAMNVDRQLTGVFAGDLLQAHAAGARCVAASAFVAVPSEFDIVITSNAGYPLDQNLYQTVKGMSAAARVVKPGGAIIVAAECRDGVPDHGDYGALLRGAATPEGLLEMIGGPGYCRQDQWQVQIQAQILCRAEVYVHSTLPDDVVCRAMLRPCRDVSETVRQLVRRMGPDTAICVLPDGPMTIPTVAS